MQAEHLVSQCIWESQLDTQEQARALQEALSQWSKTILQDELTQFFDQQCPATQIWRIERLQLDLGDIAYQDLLSELPKRLRASLHEEFARLHTHQQINKLEANSPNHASSDKITSAPTSKADKPPTPANWQSQPQEQSPLAFIRWYLLHGCAPWWFHGAQNALQQIDAALSQQADASCELIRDLGRAEQVRLRLVRQLGEKRVRRIIALLEPWQSRFICTWADNLFVLQKERQSPTVDTAEFKQHTWFNILTHLLVDRGTLFNTMTFVRANLQRSAMHYRIDYNSLLEQMFQALQTLKPLGVLNDTFLLAIKQIYLQDHAQRGALSTATSAVQIDYWQAMQTMLHTSARQHHIGHERVQIDALFTALAQQDPQRLATLLRHEAQSASVRHGILRHFAAQQWPLLVRVLAPQEDDFILAHIEHTQALHIQKMRRGKEQKTYKRAVWQIVLNYLLSQGSVFNRQQLVQNTLQQLCRMQGVELHVLLDCLIDSALRLHASPATYELLQILQILQEIKTEQAEQASFHRPKAYHLALIEGLQTGKAPANLPPLTSLLRQFLQNSPEHPTNQDASGYATLASVLRAPSLHTLSDAQLSWRLLKLVGPAELPLLFETLAARASAVCLSLMKHVALWKQGGYLPALDKIDLAYQLPALLLQALLSASQIRQGKHTAFDVAAFWEAFCRVLQRESGVDALTFQQQLLHCPGFANSLPQLNTPLNTQPNTPLSNPLSRFRPLTAPTHWQYLLRQDSKGFAAWIKRQENWPNCLASLLKQRHLPIVQRCFMAQLPSQFRQHQKLLQTWAKLLRLSGCWQGAQRVLEQQLEHAFWLACFEGGTRDIGQLLQNMARNACLRLNIRWQDWQTCLQDHAYLLHNSVWALACKGKPQAMLASQPNHTLAAALPTAAFRQDYAARYLQHPRLADIVQHLLRKGHAPRWLASTQPLDLKRLLFDVLALCPQRLPELLGKLAANLHANPAILFRLSRLLPFTWLIDAMRQTTPQHEASIALLLRFEQVLNRLDLSASAQTHCSELWFQLVLQHWLEQNWAALTLERITSQFFYRLKQQQTIPHNALQQAFAATMEGLPVMLKQALSPHLAPKMAAPPKPMKSKTPLPVPEKLSHPLPINNGGLVLLQSFFTPLFSRLKMLQDGQFIDLNAQRRAVHYLQFLVSGQQQTPEQYLMLNKLLCGLGLHEPIEAGIEMTAAEIELCTSLIGSVIGYWPAIGSSSIDGFRGNWLVRNATLVDANDHWAVNVEKRPYDLLLARAPFSYTVIKLPWMQKAVYVSWPT